MEPNEEMVLRDDRRTAHGWPRALLILIAIFAGVFTWIAIVSATGDVMDHHPGRAALTVLAALVWVAMAVGLLHNGRRMRRIAWATAAVNLLADLITFVWTTFPVDVWSPWYRGGANYLYVPALLAMAALAWLYHSSPARLAQDNG